MKKNHFVLFLLLPLIFSCSHSMHGSMSEGMDHSAHRAMMKEKSNFTESVATYQVPDVVLLNQVGEKIYLKEYLENNEPYAVNFIFTTCTTICPILTASFSHMQRELGEDAEGLQLISITIDPEYDTPKVLNDYAQKVRATKNWTFLTGDYETIVTVEKAFDSYTSNKMDHRPSYIFKTDSSTDWVRIDGLASGSDLADIYQLNSLF